MGQSVFFEGTLNFLMNSIWVENESGAPSKLSAVDTELHLGTRTSSDSYASFRIIGQVTNKIAMNFLKHSICVTHVVPFQHEVVLEAIWESDANGRDTIEGLTFLDIDFWQAWKNYLCKEIKIQYWKGYLPEALTRQGRSMTSANFIFQLWTRDRWKPPLYLRCRVVKNVINRTLTTIT